MGNSRLPQARMYFCLDADVLFEGLAVSGGVDSMALASLCSQIQRIPYDTLRSSLQADYNKNITGTPLSKAIKFQAFVVDHGVRKGSNLEAQAVSEILEARDIPTKLLKIDWLGQEKPADLPNFESLARKYRFQALGTACRDLGISSLFLAQHQDDQAETVMMRLINGHSMAGLTGIPKCTEIPECYGLYGVHESGGVNKAHKVWTRSVLGSNTMPTPVAPLEGESGGVKVYRPLLEFTKESLIATCQEDGMKWFEDHTNKDPTVTMRNAIRHLYKNHALPATLSKPALLELSTMARIAKRATLNVTNTWLRRSSVKLETSPGTLRVRFVNLGQYDRSRVEVDGKYAAAALIRRIVMLVTPQEHVKLSSLLRAVERVFPEWFRNAEASPLSTTFTVAGLQFKFNSPPRLHRGYRLLEKCEWLVSRQPYKVTAALPRFEIPRNPKSLAPTDWSSWNLYDGRFWIRVQNLSNEVLVVRPFNKLDLAGVKRSSLWKGKRYKVQKLLSELAPGDIRWTLPAIATMALDGKERLLALPTLYVGVVDVEKLVKWQVRYKKVDMDVLTLSDIK
ncbi:tRNA(Ile)-lysidine synthetase [Hyphodiscus hymeniophilus]|uniref:tRNA(Ile)-lysidine synthetase n=1 Tax=Hyphodiscus hymeniophilus TaxID=353542 RepID=A0A9P6VNG4_9HELO|nr:tRNA(Ile)-lysidine synthetase [Hyphodiscus hymeniophilus]